MEGLVHTPEFAQFAAAGNLVHRGKGEKCGIFPSLQKGKRRAAIRRVHQAFGLPWGSSMLTLSPDCRIM